MPGVGHLIYGFCIIIPILIFAKDRFNFKIGVVFIATNWLGPDSSAPYFFIPFDFHSLLGYAIWAIPLALFYSYLSRYSIQRAGKFIKLVDDGKRDLTWKNAYLVSIAGGVSHTLIDALFHFGNKYSIAPGWGLTHEQILEWGALNYHQPSGLTLIGYVIMLSIILLSLYILHKEMKDILIFFAVAIALVFITVLSLDSTVFGGELEMSTIFVSVIFIFFPLSLLFYVAKDVYENPTTIPETSKFDKELTLKIITGISLVLFSVFLFLGIFALIDPSFILDEIDLGGETVLLLAILIIVLSSLGLAGGIGLFFKNSISRYIVLAISHVLLVFVFPYAIVLFLCDKEISEMFNSEKNILEASKKGENV